MSIEKVMEQFISTKWIIDIRLTRYIGMIRGFV